MNREITEETKNKFDYRDVKVAIDLPAPMKLLQPFMKPLFYLLNHFQKLLFKLTKTIGAPIGRLLGAEVETTAVRLPEVFVITKDGAKMATDIYLPKDVYENKGKCPTILVRLPYWKDMLSILGFFIASKGYVAVLQDIRGCAHSIPYGTNSFFTTEGDDGRETLEWLTKRFWYNKKIGMWGISYLGVTQLSLTSNHKGLVTCFNPEQCSYTNIFYHPGGMYRIGLNGAVYVVTHFVGKYVDSLPLNYKKWDEKGIAQNCFFNPFYSMYNEAIEDHYMKLSDLANMTKTKYMIKVMNQLYKCNVQLNKPDDGSYEKLIEGVFHERTMRHDHQLLPFSFGTTFEFDTPTFMLGGWYDMFIEESLRDLKEIQKNSPDFFKNKFVMIIGPWAHGMLDKFRMDIDTPRVPPLKSLGQFLPNFMQFKWFDEWLKGDGMDLSKSAPIRVFVLNNKKWRNLYSWPPPNEEYKLYLHSNGNANSVNGDGTLSTNEPGEENPDTYLFDPANPAPMIGGRNLFLLSGPQNQLKIEKRTDILVYSTPKLKQGIEFIGEFRLILYAATSAKDTDFTVKLVDVSPSGRKAVNIVDSGVRTRFRDGDMNNPSLIEPGKIYKYEIYIGGSAIYFPKNHRIRVEVSSSHFPRYTVNSNLAGEKNDKGYIIANQTIYHDKEHPTHLILPKYIPK